MDKTAVAEQVDLSEYIAAEKLSAMSDLERKCCANRIRNYNVMKEIGITTFFLNLIFQIRSFMGTIIANSVVTLTITRNN